MWSHLFVLTLFLYKNIWSIDIELKLSKKIIASIIRSELVNILKLGF